MAESGAIQTHPLCCPWCLETSENIVPIGDDQTVADCTIQGKLDSWRVHKKIVLAMSQPPSSYFKPHPSRPLESILDLSAFGDDAIKAYLMFAYNKTYNCQGGEGVLVLHAQVAVLACAVDAPDLQYYADMMLKHILDQHTEACYIEQWIKAIIILWPRYSVNRFDKKFCLMVLDIELRRMAIAHDQISRRRKERIERMLGKHGSLLLAYALFSARVNIRRETSGGDGYCDCEYASEICHCVDSENEEEEEAAE